MRTLTGTVLPLVLAFGVVLVLLIGARRPPQRVAHARPVATLLSIWTGGRALFVLAMTIYCSAQPHGAAHRIRTAVAEGLVLAAGVLVPALVAVLVASRRSSTT